MNFREKKLYFNFLETREIFLKFTKKEKTCNCKANKN